MDAASARSTGARGGLTMHDTPLTLRDAVFAIALGLALGALVAIGI
jgi:hypothetical protein